MPGCHLLALCILLCMFFALRFACQPVARNQRYAGCVAGPEYVVQEAVDGFTRNWETRMVARVCMVSVQSLIVFALWQ